MDEELGVRVKLAMWCWGEEVDSAVRPTRLQQQALLLLPRASELESLFASLIDGTKEPNTYPLRDTERE